jgi:hypothetical protein
MTKVTTRIKKRPLSYNTKARQISIGSANWKAILTASTDWVREAATTNWNKNSPARHPSMKGL